MSRRALDFPSLRIRVLNLGNLYRITKILVLGRQLQCISAVNRTEEQPFNVLIVGVLSLGGNIELVGFPLS